jgi:hypothetical protein
MREQHAGNRNCSLARMYVQHLHAAPGLVDIFGIHKCEELCCVLQQSRAKSTTAVGTAVVFPGEQPLQQRAALSTQICMTYVIKLMQSRSLDVQRSNSRAADLL